MLDYWPIAFVPLLKKASAVHKCKYWYSLIKPTHPNHTIQCVCVPCLFVNTKFLKYAHVASLFVTFILNQAHIFSKSTCARHKYKDLCKACVFVLNLHCSLPDISTIRHQRLSAPFLLNTLISLFTFQLLCLEPADKKNPTWAHMFGWTGLLH